MVWIPWTIAAVVGVLCLVGVARIIIGDRSKGRRRCPECWHSMEGLGEPGPEGWVCTECGRATADVRAMHRTRRFAPRRLIAAALLLSLAGVYMKGVTNRWLEGNPKRWIPTLPAVLFVSREPDTLGSFRAAFDSWMEAMLTDRFGTAYLPAWQAELLAWRFTDEDSEEIWGAIRVPEAWVSGHPIPIIIDTPASSAGLLGEGITVQSARASFMVTRRAGATRFRSLPPGGQPLAMGGAASDWCITPVYWDTEWGESADLRMLVSWDLTGPAVSVGPAGLVTSHTVLGQAAALAGGAPSPSQIGSGGQSGSPGPAGSLLGQPGLAPPKPVRMHQRDIRTFTLRLAESPEGVESPYTTPVRDPAADAFLASQPFWEAWVSSEPYLLRPVSVSIPAASAPDISFPVDAELCYLGVVICRVTRDLRIGLHSGDLFRCAESRRHIRFPGSGGSQATLYPTLDAFPVLTGSVASAARAEVADWRWSQGSVSSGTQPLLSGFTVRYRPNPGMLTFGVRDGRYWVPADGSDYLEVPLTDVIVR